MPKMSEIRAKFPMYDDVSDEQLLIGLRKKYYSDIPPAQFYGSIDYDTERARLQKENIDSMSVADKFDAGVGKAANDIYRSGKRIANI